MARMERAAGDIGPRDADDGADAPSGDQRHAEAREDPTWNLGGLGNAAGEGASDVATPSSSWNPGGVGNAQEPGQDEEEASPRRTTGREAHRPASPPIPVDSEDGRDMDSPGQKDTGE